LIEVLDLDDRARRIRALTPQFCLHLVDERTKAEHVGDEDDESHGIAQGRAFGLGDQLHVQEGL
jgi:hypothetical protein